MGERHKNDKKQIETLLRRLKSQQQSHLKRSMGSKAIIEGRMKVVSALSSEFKECKKQLSVTPPTKSCLLAYWNCHEHYKEILSEFGTLINEYLLRTKTYEDRLQKQQQQIDNLLYERKEYEIQT